MAAILVIDDDPYIRELVHTLLKNEGFSIHEAGNGREALQKLGEAKIDLCVLDLMMPGMDGFEVCEKIRSDPDTMHIPVVMVTALSDVTDRVRGLEAGADDFLTKPFALEELEALVQRKFDIPDEQ